MALVKCPDCGRDISDAANSCIGCGRPMTAAATPTIASLSGEPLPAATSVAVRSLPSPGVAAVLSLIIPGAGQMYAGSVLAGFVFFFGTLFGYALFVVPGLIMHLIAVVTAAGMAS